MAWTQPKTWSNEPLIAADMNTHIRDNLLAVRQPPLARGVLGASQTITSTSSIAVHADLDLTLSLDGFGCFVCFNGVVDASAGVGRLDIEINGVDYLNAYGNWIPISHTNQEAVAIIQFIPAVSLLAGSNNFKLKAFAASGNVVVRAGARLWVVES